MTVHDAVTVLKKIRCRHRRDRKLRQRCTELIASITSLDGVYGGHHISHRMRDEVYKLAGTPLRLAV